MNKEPENRFTKITIQTIICAKPKSLHHMAISIRFKESELNVIRQYATSHNMSVSEVIRKATIEMIEDALDVEMLESAMERHSKNNSKMYTFDEADREIGFK